MSVFQDSQIQISVIIQPEIAIRLSVAITCICLNQHVRIDTSIESQRRIQASSWHEKLILHATDDDILIAINEVFHAAQKGSITEREFSVSPESIKSLDIVVHRPESLQTQ